jgi:hypothetical protein
MSQPFITGRSFCSQNEKTSEFRSVVITFRVMNLLSRSEGTTIFQANFTTTRTPIWLTSITGARYPDAAGAFAGSPGI